VKGTFIFISRVEADAVRFILQNFADLYAEHEFVKGLKLYGNQNDLNDFVVLFQKDVQFEFFNFLVNYLQYPEGYDNDWKPVVKGFFNPSKIEQKEFREVGEWLMVYNPVGEGDDDAVYFVNQKQETFQFSFSGKIRKLETGEKSYRFRALNLEEYYHLAEIHPSPKAVDKLNKPWWKFW
jgi:hypothetical protein